MAGFGIDDGGGLWGNHDETATGTPYPRILVITPYSNYHIYDSVMFFTVRLWRRTIAETSPKPAITSQAPKHPRSGRKPPFPLKMAWNRVKPHGSICVSVNLCETDSGKSVIFRKKRRQPGSTRPPGRPLTQEGPVAAHLAPFRTTRFHLDPPQSQSPKPWHKARINPVSIGFI